MIVTVTTKLKRNSISVSCDKPNRITIENRPPFSVTLSMVRDGRDGIDGQNGRDGLDGRDGIDGRDGQDGLKGAAGTTPSIHPVSGNWMLGLFDTGIKAKGDKGDAGNTPTISGSTGNWTIGGVDTGVKAKGDKGDAGNTPTISGSTGNWTIGGVDTGIKATSIWGNITGNIFNQADLKAIFQKLQHESIVIKDTVPTAVLTGTVTSQIYSIRIPANTFDIGSVFSVKIWIAKSGSAGTMQNYIYVGDTATELTFSRIIASHTKGASANAIPMIRTFIVQSDGLRCIQWNLNTSNDEVVQIAAFNMRGNFNPAMDQYLNVTGLLSVGTETQTGFLFLLNGVK